VTRGFILAVDYLGDKHLLSIGLLSSENNPKFDGGFSSYYVLDPILWCLGYNY